MKKPSAAALRLCHAVGLVTGVKVGRWVGIDEAVALLPAADRAAEAQVIEAAIGADLVAINSGPVAHSISLTAAGLDACQAATRVAKPRSRAGR